MWAPTAHVLGGREAREQCALSDFTTDWPHSKGGELRASSQDISLPLLRKLACAPPPPWELGTLDASCRSRPPPPDSTASSRFAAKEGAGRANRSPNNINTSQANNFL